MIRQIGKADANAAPRKRAAAGRRTCPRLCGAGPESHHGPRPDSRRHGISRFGAYDFHDYNAAFDFRSRGHIAQQERSAAVWAKYAHREGNPVFLSEFGAMAYGWVPD